MREAHAGPTGTAAERHDPLYIWALQHDDHCTRQKLEAGWQLGMRQEVRMTCAARAMAKALQVSITYQTSNVLGFDNAGEAPTASTQRSRIDIGSGDGIRVQNEGVPVRERVWQCVGVRTRRSAPGPWRRRVAQGGGAHRVCRVTKEPGLVEDVQLLPLALGLLERREDVRLLGPAACGGGNLRFS